MSVRYHTFLVGRRWRCEKSMESLIDVKQVSCRSRKAVSSRLPPFDSIVDTQESIFKRDSPSYFLAYLGTLSKVFHRL
jgi:hypothetical protein